MKFINNSIFPSNKSPFFDGIIYGHLRHQVLFPANPCFKSLSICHTPDLQPLLHAGRMLPDLIMHPERDQQTSEPSLSWASEQEQLQIHGGNRNWGKKKKTQNKKIMSSHRQQWPLISPVTGEQHLRVKIIIQTPDIQFWELLRREKLRKEERTRQKI